MYVAQRDAKAALRWIVAHSNTYNINTDYMTVGGASAGAITIIALGISNQEDVTMQSMNTPSIHASKCVIDYCQVKNQIAICCKIFVVFYS